jgi:hypothetical protein
VVVYGPAREVLASAPQDRNPGDDKRLLNAIGAAGVLVVEIAGGECHGAQLSADGRPVGWVVHSGKRSNTEPDRHAFDLLRLAISSVLVHVRAGYEAEQRHRAELLELLVTDAGAGIPRRTSSAASRYDFRQEACLAVARSAGDARERTARLARVATEFAAIRPGRFLVSQSDEDVTIVGPSGGEWPATIHSAMTAAAGPTVLGVGPVVARTCEYRDSLVLARKAVDALLALGRVGVLAAAEHGLEQLILEATDPRRLVSFERQILDPLRAYDERRGAQLVLTLESVYERNWNLQAAARSLHVHVSTLRYRLSRIEELASVDLGDQDDRLALHLALRISKLLGVPGAPPRTEALKTA